jgi:hypothetical protein
MVKRNYIWGYANKIREYYALDCHSKILGLNLNQNTAAPDLQCPRFSLSSCRKGPRNIPRLGHDSLLSNPFWFIIHPTLYEYDLRQCR